MQVKKLLKTEIELWGFIGVATNKHQFFMGDNKNSKRINYLYKKVKINKGCKYFFCLKNRNLMISYRSESQCRPVLFVKRYYF